MKNNNISRKSKFRSKKQAPANYLIICEGKQTEPNYFIGLKKKINEKYENKIDIFIPNIDIKGTGMNTQSLVNYTQRVVNHSNKIYGQVWVVFDKDDYDDKQFDTAINNCNYHVAWSNPNFELWLLAHFKRVDRYISKDSVLIELNKEFKRSGLKNYVKNDEAIFDKITDEVRLYTAINNCRYMEKLNESRLPSQRNPMTKVYKIVEDLKEYLK